jgi:hypothetical protein
MVNRDLYTADGREWFEPHPSELVETKEQVRTTTTSQTCAVCGETVPPQTMRFKLERERTWTQTSAISGKFSAWGAWRVVSVECLRHEDDEVIPF